MDQKTLYGFIVFKYNTYYPIGGEGDIAGVFDSLERAVLFIHERPADHEYADVYDVALQKTVAEFCRKRGIGSGNWTWQRKAESPVELTREECVLALQAGAALPLEVVSNIERNNAFIRHLKEKGAEAPSPKPT